MPKTEYSPELIERCTADNLLERARISDLGSLAAGYANPIQPPGVHFRKKGDSYYARMFARQAAHDARILFPDLFLWENERYGQQLNLGDVA